MKVIYIDVLVIINIYVGFFLVNATGRLLGEPACKWRIAVGSILSGLFATIILLDLNIIELLALRIAMALIITAVVFHHGRLWRWLKSCGVFVIVSCLFGGVMYAVSGLAEGSGLTVKNGVCYIGISTVTLVIYTIIAYCVILLFDNMMKRRTPRNELCRVTVTFNDKSIEVTGLIDTGNKLVDIFSGTPVIICELERLRTLLPLTLYSYLKHKGSTDSSNDDVTDYVKFASTIRVIPTRAVSGESSLMAFKPQRVQVDSIVKSMLIAVVDRQLSDGSYRAIVPNV